MSPPAILIVEDDARVRRFTNDIVRGNGWPTIVAGSAIEGLLGARHYGGPIPLAIVDLIMPGIGGLDLANQLAIDLPSTKVLYISGYTDSIVLDGIRLCAPERLLRKPFTARELRGRLDELLAH